MLGKGLKNTQKKGNSMMDVLMSVVVISIVILGTIAIFLFTHLANLKAKEKMVAVSLAKSKISYIQATFSTDKFAKLTDFNSGQVNLVSANGITSKILMNGEILDLGEESSQTISSFKNKESVKKEIIIKKIAENPSLYMITVTIRWSYYVKFGLFLTTPKDKKQVPQSSEVSITTYLSEVKP